MDASWQVEDRIIEGPVPLQVGLALPASGAPGRLIVSSGWISATLW